MNPYSPDAPFIQSKIAVAYEGSGDFASAAAAREQIVESYGPQSEWATMSGDSSNLAEVDSLRASALEHSIQYHAQQVAEADQGSQQALQSYSSLIDKIELYLADYPDSREAYEFKFLLGDSYYNTGDLAKAGDVYLSVVYDSTSTQQREKTACISVRKCMKSVCTMPTHIPLASMLHSSCTTMQAVITMPVIIPLPGNPT